METLKSTAMKIKRFFMSQFLYIIARLFFIKKNISNIDKNEKEIILIILKKYCDKLTGRKIVFKRKLKRIFKKVDTEIYTFQNLKKEMRQTYNAFC